MEKKCLVCGTIFRKGSSTSLNEWTYQSKFCSRKCYWAARKGGKEYPGFWKGKHLPDSVKKQISETNKRKGIEPIVKFSGSGFKNPTWRGEKAGYFSIHRWVQRNKKKPTVCALCGDPIDGVFHWANVDHQYKRNLDDFIGVHVKCHRQYDKDVPKIPSSVKINNTK